MFGQGHVQRDADFISGGKPVARREVKTALPRGGKQGAADLFPAAQDLESVPLFRRERACAEPLPLPAGERSGAFADVPLHAARKKVRVLPECESARVISAVERAFQAGKELVGGSLVQQRAIVFHRRRDVGRRAHSALDLEGRHAGRKKFFRVRSHRQIGQGNRIGAILIPRAVDRIPLAAGLFASAAVARIVARERGEIALARKTGAERPLYERLRLDDFGNGGNVPDRRLAREHDAGKTARLCKPRPVHVAAARLRGEMGHDLRTEFPERASEKDILQKDRIGARVPRLARRTEKVGKLIVLHKGIECDIYLCAQKMRFPRQLCKRRNAKIFRALARGKSRQSQIYGVRARTKRRVCRFFVPGGGKKFGHYLPIVRAMSSCAASYPMFLSR